MKKLLYIIVIALFFFLVLAPLLSIFIGSFIKNGHFSIENYARIFTGKTLNLLLFSILLAATVSLASTTIGGLIAFFVVKTDVTFRNSFKFLLLIPLFLSPYIIAVSWVDFFVLLGVGTDFIYSPAGVVFVLSFIFAPLSMLVISSGLTNISSGLEEAGLMMTSRFKTILKIILPLIKPSIITSLILVFVLSISEFSVPAFLSVNVFVTEIFVQFSAFYRHEAAVANSLVLISMCVFLLMLEKFYLADAPFLTVSSKAQRIKITELNRCKIPVVFFLAGYLTISVIIPIVVLIIQAFQTGAAALGKALKLLAPTIAGSIFYAGVGALLLVLFGFVFAWMTEREKIRPINTILLFVFGVPSTVLGIALIKFFNTPVLSGIYTSFGIIIFGYLGRFIFIVEKLIANALKQIPDSFDESAQMMGAGFFVRLRKILLPLVLPALFGAFVIGFLLCLAELGTTILVYPPGVSVMPIKVYTIMANAPQGLTSAMSLVVLMITFAGLALLFVGYRFLNGWTKKRCSF